MKRKNLKKFTAAAMSAVLVAGMLSGCGKKAETTTEDGKEVVELTWYQVGDTQKDQQMVKRIYRRKNRCEVECNQCWLGRLQPENAGGNQHR
mgnify:CR=1 FL=1